MQPQRGSQLEGIEGAQGKGQAVPHHELLSNVEIAKPDGCHLPQASGDVGKKPPADQVEIGGGELPCAYQAGQYGMHLDDTEGGKEVARSALGEEGFNLGGADFGTVM